MTAASATAGWAMSAFSRSTELIHSPPDLIRSLVRSEILTNPSESTEATSPVRSQPSAVNWSVGRHVVVAAGDERPAHMDLADALAVPGLVAYRRHRAPASSTSGTGTPAIAARR